VKGSQALTLPPPWIFGEIKTEEGDKPNNDKF
jgi:hypothetical protein